MTTRAPIAPVVPFDDRPTRVGANTEIWDVLCDLGVDPAHVFAAAGVARSSLADAEMMIAMGDLARLVQEAIAATARPDFGLVLGERVGVKYVGVLLERMAREKNLRAALETLVALFPINTRAAVARLHSDDDQATLEIGISHPFSDVAAVFDDAIISIAGFAIRTLVGPGWRPSRILLSHQPLAPSARYRRVLGAPVRFNATVSAIVFPAADLARPLVADAPLPAAIVEAALAAAAAKLGLDIEDRVRVIIREGLADPALSLAHVASLTVTTPRSLNRRLAAQGTSYAALLRQTRYATARQLLAQAELPLGVVAVAVGYPDQAVFSRAFHAWSGMSPRNWRRMHRNFAT